MPIDKATKLWVGPSNSEQYLSSRSSIPPVSSSMSKSVSDFRKSAIAGEIELGLFRDGSTPHQKESSEYGSTYNGRAVSGVAKYGQVVGGSGGGFRGGFGDTVMQAPEVYSPLWLNSNLSLPRDRATINAWCRSFYALNPFVHNAIGLHSTYPLAKLNITCPNKEIEKFFNDMIEEIDLMSICVQIAQEFWLLGEAFVYAELDEGKGKWSRLMIQNPDYMIVKRSVVADEPMISLRPDENLKKIITSNRPADIEQRKQLNPYIIDSVKRGGNIPMDNFNVSHLARRISPYEIRGTGLPVCVFRQLMLWDQLRESKYAQASEMINPMTLIKIGTDAADGLHPTFADLEAWRDVFESASNNKNFKVFTHAGVAVERVGWGQGIYDISGDITQLMKEIFIGLQAPPVVMGDTGDTTYANGGVALDVLRQRYMQFRNMMSAWLKRKIFAPISKIQGFYDYAGGEKQLIVPEVDWNHMSLFDTGDFINTLVTLTQGTGDQKRASQHTLYRSMGLDWDDEQRKIRKEIIQAAIMKKEQAALEAMDLNSLRSLDDEDEISEPKDGTAPKVEAPVPGETTGGLPELDLGSAPPSLPPAPEAPPAAAPPAPAA
jgi:hypothetical protein